MGPSCFSSIYTLTPPWSLPKHDLFSPMTEMSHFQKLNYVYIMEQSKKKKQQELGNLQIFLSESHIGTQILKAYGDIMPACTF